MSRAIPRVIGKERVKSSTGMSLINNTLSLIRSFSPGEITAWTGRLKKHLLLSQSRPGGFIYLNTQNR